MQQRPRPVPPDGFDTDDDRLLRSPDRLDHLRDVLAARSTPGGGRRIRVGEPTVDEPEDLPLDGGSNGLIRPCRRLIAPLGAGALEFEVPESRDRERELPRPAGAFPVKVEIQRCPLRAGGRLRGIEDQRRWRDVPKPSIGGGRRLTEEAVYFGQRLLGSGMALERFPSLLVGLGLPPGSFVDLFPYALPDLLREVGHRSSAIAKCAESRTHDSTGGCYIHCAVPGRAGELERARRPWWRRWLG